jgi:SAM-dependent methyltransferase|tara:strand:+ start:4465 stop:5118 length:654 start_codon:yes stop_codon:yes gene_type:complete
LDQKILDQQSQYWEKNFSNKPEMFGLKPSVAAVKALKKFKEENISNIIELGAGLGRDTIFFAQNSIYVHALDYSSSAISIINKKKDELNLSKYIKTQVFDIRKKLPFTNENFQGCFSHMLYCMALSNNNIQYLNKEIFRILKKGGLNIYTVRNFEDGDYKNGIHIGEDLYENDGFVVHFFSKDKIKESSKKFKTLHIEKLEEGSFPRKLYIIQNQKN